MDEQDKKLQQENNNGRQAQQNGVWVSNNPGIKPVLPQVKDRGQHNDPNYKG